MQERGCIPVTETEQLRPEMVEPLAQTDPCLDLEGDTGPLQKPSHSKLLTVQRLSASWPRPPLCTSPGRELFLIPESQVSGIQETYPPENRASPQNGNEHLPAEEA